MSENLELRGPIRPLHTLLDVVLASDRLVGVPELLAAARLEFSTRTIKRWTRGGLTCRQVSGIIIIDHPVLMTTYRNGWPTTPA